MKFESLSVVIAGAPLTASIALRGDKDRQAKAVFDNTVKLFKDCSCEESADEFRRADAINQKSKNHETAGLRMIPLVELRVAGMGFSGEL
jgi:hypothetical protein